MKIFYAAVILLFSLQLSAAPPTVPASNLSFNAIDGGYFNIGWTAGNGAKRIIICKAGSPVNFIPQNGVSYTANTNFGNGQQVETGEYIVYNSAFTSFYLTGLTAATQYYFAVYEYNGTGATTEYFLTALTGNAFTSSVPTVQVSNVTFSSITTSSVTINWTKGNGQRRLIVAREASAVNSNPVNNTAYNANAAFGSGVQIGTGNYVVYTSTGTSVVITNLKGGTTYHFALYEFNGSSQPQYKTPALTTSITTRSVPTIASSNVVITKADGKELSLSWTNGNGQRRIIIAKQGSNVTAVPANNTVYAANNNFGSGFQIAAGEYVVSDDNFNAATIKGLNPATVYYFKIFEYDGGAGTASYLTNSYGAVNGSTAATPTIQGSAISSSNPGANSLNLLFTKGNGRARIIIARKDVPVNVTPQDFTVYEDGNFGEGDNLGNENFVVSNTTDAGAAIQKLEANTTYHFAVFEYNGYNQPLYLSPALTFSAKTLSPLPVKLKEWSVTAINKTVNIQWTTSTEINSSHFVIERSNNGTEFIAIKTIAAAGNSEREIKYNTEDIAPANGKLFYRIKLVDKDGSFDYSVIRTVLITSDEADFTVNSFVNRNIELVKPSFSNEKQSFWVITNAAGQVIKRGVVTNRRTLINLPGLPAGNYYISLKNKDGFKSRLFIKQ